ncbi:hypothetical protein T484DRAFT_3634426 [Cryptophyta sp. CCMP2293]|nr:hypothetical protein T484DRAFT_3634426 [Cryptophyta sp. CCMP2293]
MDQDVAEDESVMGVQAPVASSRKKVTCATCGSGFSKQANLKRHVEKVHSDQTTPEAVAKRLELQEYLNTNRRERRANDRVYREKMQQVDRTNRAKKKARVPAAAGGTDADASINEPSADADASSASINEPSADAPEPDNRREGGGRVKPPRAHTNALPAAPGVFRVTTTALTTANVTGFFSPKYSAPRSKEQRLAAPRSNT